MNKRLVGWVKEDGDCLLWQGSTVKGDYGRINVSGRLVLVHRWVWEQENGPIPEGKEIDHTCHKRRCVNGEHLRIATRSQNGQNLKGGRGKSGVRGVMKRPNGKFLAHVETGRKQYSKTFPTLEDASAWAEAKRAELFGEFAGGK